MDDLTGIPKKLKLISGSQDEIHIHLADNRDSAEDLNNVTEAVLSVFSDQDSAALLTRTLNSNMTANVAEKRFEADPPTELEFESLVPGQYIADMVLVISGVKYYTDPFYVEVSTGYSELP